MYIPKAFTHSILFVLILSHVLFHSCTPHTHIRVSRYNKEMQSFSRTPFMIYYLPQTSLDFHFRVAVERYTEGPYSQYSEKFLGIPQQQRKSETSLYRIVQTSVTTRQTTDEQYPFLVELINPKSPSQFLSLTHKGLLLPANRFIVRGDAKQSQCFLAPYPFFDRSAEPFVDTESTIHHTTVQHDDSTFVTVPIPREVVVKRSTEAKARQAAELIFALRKRRLDLIAGDEVPTSPQVLATILQELERLEKNYLTLFVGQTQRDTLQVTLSLTPKMSSEPQILGRFSHQHGFVSTTSHLGSELLLQLKNTEQYAVRSIDLPPQNDAYYYCTQEEVALELLLENQMLYSGQVPLSQFGTIQTTPIQNIFVDER